MYIFYSWMIDVRKYSFAEVPAAMAASLVLALLCLKLNDEPLRRRLSGKGKRL